MLRSSSYHPQGVLHQTSIYIYIYVCVCVCVCVCVGFTLSQATKALRESRGIAVLYFRPALKGDEGSASRPGSTLPPGKTRYPFYKRLGGPQGRSGLVRTGIRSPDRPARRQSLYRLRYPAHYIYIYY